MDWSVDVRIWEEVLTQSQCLPTTGNGKVGWVGEVGSEKDSFLGAGILMSQLRL